MELPFDPAIPLLGLYPKNTETPIQKNLCTPMFIAAQFTIAKYWKQPKCPSANEWIKKLWYIYTMEFYAAERKECVPFATSWMELESIIVSYCNPLSQLSFPHSPLAIVKLFLTSMSLVIFCLLFSSVDYVPVKGEIIWYLSLTAWLISLSIMLSSSIHAVAKGISSFFLSAT